ncbi:MAG: T9SS type A sorting domain-containing protein, partial [Ignavibacteriales bacterium]|nr:T9SS type A sorting domain-containing protein [Ignavibacteriales bacterium]
MPYSGRESNSFEIFDVTGKRLYYSLNDAGMNELNTRINVREMGLASGVYFLRVFSSGTRNYTKTAKFQVWEGGEQTDHNSNLFPRKTYSIIIRG